jgi:hypothetical protein
VQARRAQRRRLSPAPVQLSPPRPGCRLPPAVQASLASAAWGWMTRAARWRSGTTSIGGFHVKLLRSGKETVMVKILN